jgi:hypothetical protein
MNFPFFVPLASTFHRFVKKSEIIAFQAFSHLNFAGIKKKI